uniref:CSRNP_N domain-containing protein n=1 Tax=Anopheles christyi TaxID=43041 RepID=A0A182KAG7_9DIPT
MLKPLKDLLTYLQRNANSSNIFGLTSPTSTTTTNTMGPNENPRMEETIIVSDELALDEGGDPLHDPLALDDCPNGTDVNVSSGSLGSEDDDGTISHDKIILVDVSTMKPKDPQHQDDELETEDDEEEDVVPKPVDVTIVVDDEEELMAESMNCSQEPLLELETSECSNLIIDGKKITPSEPSCNVLDTFANVEDSIRLSPSPPSLVDESETVDGEPIQLIDHYVGVVQEERRSERTAGAVETSAEQIQGTNGEEEEEASDGSDSGLGLETARNVPACGSSISSSTSNSPLQRPPIKSSLKRRSESLNTTVQLEDGVSSQKRPKKGISFDGVTVYYFPRIQGFGCVPSQGGCTLGMEFQHVHSRRLTLSEHSAEQRKVHRQQLQELNPRSSSSEDTSSEEEPSESGSEAESESYGFLQPVSTRQRRALLKAAGVRKIDPTEKDDCREIRTSREVCGCTCRGICDPNRCACSLAGIKCQVDRPNFPCGCTHEGCANTAGRVEFNPGRVRTHFLHTIMKLRMESESSKVIEPGSNAVLLSRAGSSTAAIDTTNGSGYVIGSEKNWSNGPVRLPPSTSSSSSSMVGYGAGMHAGPSSTVNNMTDGTVSIQQGMLPHHSTALQPLGNHLSHHHPPMVLQDGMHHLHQQPHHHLSHQPLAYHSQLGADGTHHQNYLPAPNSNVASHLIGAAGLPPAATDTLNLHYPYRDYYGSIEGGAVGEGGHSAGMPLQNHLPSSSTTNSTEPSATLHAAMYYTDNYASFQEAGASTTAHIHPYTQNPTVPLHHHVPNAGSTTVSRQHMLTTGHDRSIAGPSTSSFENHRDGYLRPESMPSLLDKGASGVPQVPEPVNSGVDPTIVVDTSSSSLPVVCNGQMVEQSFPSADSEHCDPNVTVISDSSRSTIEFDSSADVTIIEPEVVGPSDAYVIIEVDEGETTDSARVTNRSKARASDFIDLETPQADNAERLEAINDLLESSRHTLSIVGRSIVAEEDDELRDFQHPPAEPTSSIICLDEEGQDDDDDVDDEDDDDDVVCEDRVTRSTTAPAKAKVNDVRDPARRSYTGLSTLTNGTNRNVGEGQQQYHQKRMRCTTIGEESLKKILSNDSDEISFVSSYTMATGEDIPAVAAVAAAVVSSSTSSLLVDSTVGSLSSSTTLVEPSENLCEIIKNSIVETAVSH